MNQEITQTGQHVVAYVHRSKITHWKSLMVPRDGRPFPFVYGSRDANIFDRYVKPGNVLWVFGSSPNRPPSLVAKLSIMGRADHPDGPAFDVPAKVLAAFRKKTDHKPAYPFIAVGDPKKSRFYGYNNAGGTLLSLTLRWAKGAEEAKGTENHHTLSGEAACPEGTCTWQGRYAAPLQRPALVVDGAQALIELDRSADRTIFISWKRKDNWKRRKAIRQLAFALADEGLFAWLDVLAFPHSIALVEKVNEDEAITRALLHYGYQRCLGLLAIETENYAGKGVSENWTEMEFTGDFKDSRPPSPPPLRLIYRYAHSEKLRPLIKKNDLRLDDKSWPEVASNIRQKMEEMSQRNSAKTGLPSQDTK